MAAPDSILVIGHRNPDMDAVASAVGYAWLLKQTTGINYVAARTGSVNAQTAFALQHFGIEPPLLVTDVRPRIGDLVDALPALRRGQTLLEACQMVAHTQRSAPLLDEERRPVGLISGAGLFATMAEALSSTSVLALAKDLDRPAEAAADTASIVLGVQEYVQDVVNQALRSDQDEFIVVDESGAYVGLSRKSDLLSPPRRQVVMVDHNEPGQAVLGLEAADVIEVLDHHRLSSVPTAVPIRFRVEPVGSCSTLVMERANELHQRFPAPVAGLLLCGILSDTLTFRSPTATGRDRDAATDLAVMAGLASADADEDHIMVIISELGSALLAAGAGLGARPADEVVNTDIKFYEVNGMNVGVAQVEVANFSELPPRLPELRDALAHLAESRDLKLALLMVTDVVRGNSRLVAVGQPRLISALPYPRLGDDTLDAPGVMSRKKQLLPLVLAVLSHSTA